MKRGLYRKMRGNNEAAEGNSNRIHLLVSVQPDNEAALASDKDGRKYDILVFDPKGRESYALIRQIALIKSRDGSDNREGVCEHTGDKIKACTSPGNTSRSNTENRSNI